MRKSSQKTISLSSWTLKGFPNGLRFQADDVSGNVGYDKDPKSVVFSAHAYDNYRQYTGLTIQHTLTFRRERDAKRFIRWLNNCTASKITSKN